MAADLIGIKMDHNNYPEFIDVVADFYQNGTADVTKHLELYLDARDFIRAQNDEWIDNLLIEYKDQPSHYNAILHLLNH